MRDINMNGKINSYLTLSAIDGPGLRFVVFLQGCKLRCIYCHNPDTWLPDNGVVISAVDIIQLMSKSDEFYRQSGGGLTVSGGEPFYQPEFTAEIVYNAKKNQYHTAVDTSGCELLSDYPDIVKNTDLFILDIKALDNKRYFSITGDSIEKSIQNGIYLSSINKKIWLRYVIIPGYNDTMDEIEAFYNAVNGMKTVERIQIIPYSKIGIHKWRDAGYISALENVSLTPPEKIRDFIDFINKKAGKIVAV
ncbi:MAG: pyruvate formate-lyase 1-activating enzyme [Spirochaetes bacterium GWF1_31_7]|nr:MAG: pyruvate formate-lyase 1-activating enzyme [Spirochaetes bacterium GWE1_32_154]OHD50985.1 MAG: pyruvate formate-lyase 1-activating enzyme [Spirochaetes bacterium GWE2_31_10]OHD51639.1 MAG: pyruvate formate-lyase 1-activating enzyme [Spirochaetes bacterium GWF1_31_7]